MLSNVIKSSIQLLAEILKLQEKIAEVSKNYQIF